MSRHDFRTTPPADVTAVHDGDGWTVIFVRELHHPPERVWRALTDPDELRAWSPFDSDRDLSTVGEATLSTAGTDGEQEPATVRRAEAPRLLEYSWGADLLRWELEPTAAGGTRLTLRHSMQDRSWLPKVIAGWHICMDVLEQALSGNRIGRIVGPAAKQWWEPLHEEYAKRLAAS